MYLPPVVDHLVSVSQWAQQDRSVQTNGPHVFVQHKT
jgi:hypothetical protein